MRDFNVQASNWDLRYEGHLSIPGSARDLKLVSFEGLESILCAEIIPNSYLSLNRSVVFNDKLPVNQIDPNRAFRSWVQTRIALLKNQPISWTVDVADRMGRRTAEVRLRG